MLVQFITGSSKVPLGGFKDLQGMHGTQKFNIHRTADTSRLPSAHTWYGAVLSTLGWFPSRVGGAIALKFCSAACASESLMRSLKFVHGVTPTRVFSGLIVMVQQS